MNRISVAYGYPYKIIIINPMFFMSMFMVIFLTNGLVNRRLRKELSTTTPFSIFSIFPVKDPEAFLRLGQKKT